MTFIPFAVSRYLKRVAHERSQLHIHRRTPNPRSKPQMAHMLSFDSDTSEVHSDSDNDKEMETGVFLHQLLEDSTYRNKPTSRPAVGFCTVLVLFVCCCVTGIVW